MGTVTKPIILLLIAGVLLVAAAGFAYLGMREFHAMLNEATENATALADAKWTAKFEKADAEANRQIADQAKVTLQIQANATEQVRQAEQQLADSEKQNEALPGGDSCGLSAARVRLLPD
jgi:hypothetical protein